MKAKSKQTKNKVKQILNNYQHDRRMLVSILQDVQAESTNHYLSEDDLIEVSRDLKIPLSQVYSVATFFRAFSLIPTGRHSMNVCLGTACHVRGALRILERIERELGINPGETTKDLKFTLETVNCVGACALGPIVIVDSEYAGEMTVDKVKPIIEEYD